MVYQTIDDFRNSYYDGMLANVFATLTGGAFLTGFALHVGMNELLIGIIGAMPFIVTVLEPMRLINGYIRSRGDGCQRYIHSHWLCTA